MLPSPSGVLDPPVERLSAEFEALLGSSIRPGETVVVARMTNTGEAFVLTSTRVIIFKDGAHNESGAARGRTFPLDAVTALTLQPGLTTTVVVVRSAVITGEAVGWRPSRCSFAVTCRDGRVARGIVKYWQMLDAARAQRRRMQRLSAPLRPIPPPAGVLLHPGERCYAIAQAALFEEQQYRAYSGGSNGMSFRIARGISYRIGGSRGRARTQTEIVKTDTGEMTLTNKRVVFVGPHRTVDIPLAQIVGVTPYSDGLRLNLSKGGVVQFLTGSDEVALLLQRVAALP